MLNSPKRMWVLLGTIAAIAAVLAAQATAAHKAVNIVIWTDSDRAAAVTKVAGDWAAANGATIKVVTKNFGDIRDNLGTVAAADAPDVITAAHDWTGQLAANGLVQPLYPSAAVKKQFPAYTLNAFSYGTAVKKLYGIPAAVENIGLVVNTKLVKIPTTFAQLESSALAQKKKSKLSFGIAVQQGSGGDAYHMYPFFSGLGGYVFGTNKAGNLDPSDIGVASATLIKNSKLVDKWNKEGLISSKVDGATAQNAFLKGQAAYWITGPWNADTLKKSGLSFKVIQVPAIVKPSVPFLGVQGFMVTKFADAHGVGGAATDLVTSSSRQPTAARRPTAPRSRATPCSRSSARRARAASRCRTSRR
jgi:arabinogalactan oligomer/maltooligosaccharide transport system substrate-binding protein